MSEKKTRPEDSPAKSGILQFWTNYKEKHPNIAEFLMFFLLSNGITVLQLALMPIFRAIFAQTNLVHIDFQIWQVGQSVDGSAHYIFDYPAGALGAGGAGGLAYFLAVQITIAIAQIINFFAQRTITFKSKSNIWKQAFWYLIAYIIITIGAAAAQGFYRAPVYNLFINTWDLGATGETIADVITMIINAAISFWVFYPIFKIIFREETEEQLQ